MTDSQMDELDQIIKHANAVERYLVQAHRAGKMGCDRLILTSLTEYSDSEIDAKTAGLKDSLDWIAKLMGNF